jgi:hypothetical protein
MTTLPRLPDRLCRDLAAPRTIVYDNGRGRIRGFGLRLPDQADLRIQLHQQRRLQTPAGFWRRHQARVHGSLRTQRWRKTDSNSRSLREGKGCG